MRQGTTGEKEDDEVDPMTEKSTAGGLETARTEAMTDASELTESELEAAAAGGDGVSPQRAERLQRPEPEHGRALRPAQLHTTQPPPGRAERRLRLVPVLPGPADTRSRPRSMNSPRAVAQGEEFRGWDAHPG